MFQWVLKDSGTGAGTFTYTKQNTAFEVFFPTGGSRVNHWTGLQKIKMSWSLDSSPSSRELTQGDMHFVAINADSWKLEYWQDVGEPPPPPPPPPPPVTRDIVQYCSDEDLPDASTVAAAKGFSTLNACSTADVPIFDRLVTLGGQFANPVYNSLILEAGLSELTEADAGHIIIQKVTWRGKPVWAVAGFHAADTTASAAWLAANDFPVSTVRIPIGAVQPPTIWEAFVNAITGIGGAVNEAVYGTLDNIYRFFTGEDPTLEGVLAITGTASAYWTPFQIVSKAIYGVDLVTGEAATWEDVTAAELVKAAIDVAFVLLSAKAVSAGVRILRGMPASLRGSFMAKAIDPTTGGIAFAPVVQGALTTSVASWPTAPQAVVGAIKVAAYLVGVDVFMDFIHEESVQTSGMGVWTLIDNEQWSSAQLALDKYRTFIQHMKERVEGVSRLNPIGYSAFKAYYEAAESQAEAYQLAIDAGLAAEAEPTVPIEIITGISNRKGTADTRFYSARDYIETLQFADTVTQAQVDEANALVDQATASVGELMNYLDLNRDVLEAAGVFTAHVDWATAKDAAADTLRTTIPAVTGPPGPPRPPPAGTGNLSVISIPTGATIFTDGDQYTFPTNTVIEGLPPRSYTVKLTKDGYNDHTETVEIIEGETREVSKTLEPAEVPPAEKGTLRVVTDPPGTEVSTAEGILGTTGDTGELTVELASGPYDITLKADGYHDETWAVLILPGQETALPKSLRPVVPIRKVWKVDVTAVDPDGNMVNAKILVNGSFTKKWSPDFILLDPGTFTFELVHADFETWSETLELGEIPQ